MQGKALVVFLSRNDPEEKQETLIASTSRHMAAQQPAAEKPVCTA